MNNNNPYKMYKKASPAYTVEDVKKFLKRYPEGVPADLQPYEEFMARKAIGDYYSRGGSSDRSLASEFLSTILGPSVLTATGALVGGLSGGAGSNTKKNMLIGGSIGLGTSLLANAVGTYLGNKAKPRTKEQQAKYEADGHLLNYYVPGLGAYNLARARNFIKSQKEPGGLFSLN